MWSIGTMLFLVYAFGRETRWVRATCAWLCILESVRYVIWRYTASLPVGQSELQTIWSWIFLISESMAQFSSITVFIFMSRRKNRTLDADKGQNSPIQQAPVDVFIATYNEPREILERTMIGALNIQHSDLRVWILDDGDRPWLKTLADELGVHYTSRYKGKHAKAGNINEGLKKALSTGREPEFVLLLDADFVASRQIVSRTLALMIDESVGIVQTPQHFFNPDPIQSNLLCNGVWPDEQRFFFNTLLECKDAWGAAFCCGTSALLRVKALKAAGGMAVETVTEDMLTSFKFEEYGYKTIFLNERLSIGLAPEGLKEYVSQRGRWCLGAIQQIYTRWSFMGRARISFISRLSCLDGMLYWMFTFPFKILMITAPMVYWWTGTAVISSSVGDLVFWLAPAALSSMVFMSIYAKNRVLPIMTDVTQLLSTFVIIRTVAMALVKPWGHGFKVTAKGVSSDSVTIHWNFMLPYAAMAVATLLGILLNISIYAAARSSDGYGVNVFWSIFNIAVLVLASATCVELPRRRKHERFVSSEAANLTFDDGSQIKATLVDISLSGAMMKVDGLVPADKKVASISIEGDPIIIPCNHIRTNGNKIAVMFVEDVTVRRHLIAKLFTGDYENEVKHVNVKLVLWTLTKRLFI